MCSVELPTATELMVKFLTDELKKSFEYASQIGNTRFMFVVTDFYESPACIFTDPGLVKRNNHVIIQIDDHYVWDSKEIVEWSKQLNDAHNHQYSMIRLYHKDITCCRFDWRARLKRYSRQGVNETHPHLYLPNRPDKEITRSDIIQLSIGLRQH